MPHRSWIDDDFHAFRASFLSSLTPNIPLQDNLRAVMLPALAKLQRYTGAAVTVHVFVNPYYQEIHALLCGVSDTTRAVVRMERQRRAQAKDLTPSSSLPTYGEKRMKVTEASSLFKDLEDEYRSTLKNELLQLMQALAREHPHEFPVQTPRAGDTVIILPLRSPEYPKLGFCLLWSPGNELREAADNHGDREARCIFQARLRQLLVKIFTNYYGMTAGTYLPSYCRPGRKKVTLMCIEIQDFDRIWSRIELHGGLSADEKQRCRLALLTQFGRIASSAVESHQGRIDQNWGSGCLGIFSEYPTTPEGSPRTGMKNALAAAVDLVKGFEAYARVWMADDFKAAAFHEYATTIALEPTVGVGIDWGPVLFDYFGSRERRTFMAVGERLKFVKDLTSVAGRIRVSGVQPLEVPSNVTWLDEYHGPPILLSHSAHLHASDVIRDAAACTISLPGRGERTRVCPVEATMIDLRAGSPITLT
jgi:class 3 adenylate cyclase